MSNEHIPEIVYIVGSGRSGSTLLDMALGGHSQVFSLGEIFVLREYIQQNKNCTCRKPLQKCAFWAPLIDLLSDQHGVDLWQNPDFIDLELINQSLRDRLKFSGELMLRSLFRNTLRRPETALTPKVQAAHDFYELVRKESQSKIVVDSSKSIRRALHLAWPRDPNSYRMIFLVRDGRGVFNSMLKRSFRIEESTIRNGEVIKVSKEQSAIHPPRSRLHYLFAWLRMTLVTIVGLRSIPPASWMMVRYEDLSSSPEITLERIAKFLDQDYEEGMLDFRNVPHHNIDGNPVRYRYDGIQPPDLQWKRKLSNKDRFLFSLLAGWLNCLLGYK